MHFKASQFEQLLGDKQLKLGLRLFEKGSVTLAERSPNGIQHFNVDDYDLRIKKKGDEILSWSCSCGRKIFCEHLSAALFFMQQETLGLELRKSRHRVTSARKSTQVLPPEKSLKELIRLAEDSAKEFPEKKILFNNIIITSIYDLYFEWLRTQAGTGLLAICKKLSDNAEKQRKNIFPLMLAIISVMSLDNKPVDDRDELQATLLKKAHNTVDDFLRKGLTASERRMLFTACLNSLKTNAVLSSEEFTFLLPRFLYCSSGRKDMETLRETLSKRKFRIPYSRQIDWLLVSKIQLGSKMHLLFKTKFTFNRYKNTNEMAIALSENAFVSGRIEKGFAILKSAYEKSKATHKIYPYVLSGYITLKARDFGRKEIELDFLKEAFINEPFISQARLNRFNELVPKKSLVTETNSIVKRIKNESGINHSEKVADLLLNSGQFNLLLSEISRQPRFALVHKIALLKNSSSDSEFIRLYTDQLLMALERCRNATHQKKIIQTAREFTHHLPLSVKNKMIGEIAEKISPAKQIENLDILLGEAAV